MTDQEAVALSQKVMDLQGFVIADGDYEVGDMLVMGHRAFGGSEYVGVVVGSATAEEYLRQFEIVGQPTPKLFPGRRYVKVVAE